jgi:hypothetical protein
VRVEEVVGALVSLELGHLSLKLCTLLGTEKALLLKTLLVGSSLGSRDLGTVAALPLSALKRQRDNVVRG